MSALLSTLSDACDGGATSVSTAAKVVLVYRPYSHGDNGKYNLIGSFLGVCRCRAAGDIVELKSKIVRHVLSLH